MDMPTATNHAPVTVAVFANALVAVIIAVAKERYKVVFSGQEANLQLIATGLGFFVAGKAAK